VLFDSTTGKLIKAATTTGLLKASTGVIAAAVSGTDYAPATSGSANQLLASNGTGGFTNLTTGTGVVTALGVSTGSSGAFVVNGGALGTPLSGTVTNLTGTASININGTVGATTANTGAFTTLSATGNVTLSGGTANGVLYLNGSKVATSGSALTFDGANGGTSGNWSAGNLTSNSGGYIRTNRADNATYNEIKYATGDLFYFNQANGGAYQFNISGSEQMRLTTTGLGIGTSSPAAKLDVAAPSGVVRVTSTTGTNSVYYQASNTGGGLYMGRDDFDGGVFYTGSPAYGSIFLSTGAYPMAFAVDSVERMRLDSSGNLGIGTTTPNTYAAKLAVSGNISALNGSGLVVWDSTNSTATAIKNVDNTLSFVKNNGTITVVINDSGNLILGPGDGTATVSGNTFRAPNAAGTNIAGANLTIASGNGTGTGGSGIIAFQTAAAGSSGTTANTMTERVRITSGGIFQVDSSISSATALSTTNPLRIYTGTSTFTDTGSAGTRTHGTIVAFDNPAIAASNAVTYTNASTVYIDGAPTAGSNVTLTNPYALYINAGNVSAAGVYSATVGGTNRDVYVDNTGLIGYVSSTRASKTNITNITDANWLLQLNPVSFNYRKKDEAGNYTEEADGPIEFGLIAEDTEAIKPELCFYDDVDGKQELRGISYSKLITPMLKLLQEQQALITSLAARVAALEGTQP
jgi:hypothetical protein